MTEAAAASLPSSDKNTLRRVIDYVRETSDDTVRDVNRKLQRVLEETLTKNMHLQKVMLSFPDASFLVFGPDLQKILGKFLKFSLSSF